MLRRCGSPVHDRSLRLRGHSALSIIMNDTSECPETWFQPGLLEALFIQYVRSTFLIACCSSSSIQVSFPTLVTIRSRKLSAFVLCTRSPEPDTSIVRNESNTFGSRVCFSCEVYPSHLHSKVSKYVASTIGENS